MHKVLGPLAVVALLVPALAWPARAGDGKSVEDRLAALEKRVTAVEETVNTLRDFLFAARLEANEAAAIATLRNFVGAEAQFQAAAVTDEDGDGQGEYGGLMELAGAVAGRMAAPLSPPVLSPAFKTLNANGEVVRSGYCFRIFLAKKGGTPLAEPAQGFAKGSGHDVELSEVVWCCYAWPQKYGTSGKRTFFVNQEGDVLATEDAAYSGTGAGPAGDAAFKAPDKISGPSAAGATGADGNIWKPF
jgi:uncharacterized coiled-coil protein SlyX